MNFKWWARKNLTSVRLLNKLRLLTTRKNSYLFQKGWVKTLLCGYPCDKDGNALPWMNFSFLHFIEERITKDHSIIEFGGGYSTLYWAKKAKCVYGIEHDNFFAETIRPELPVNGFLLVPGEENSLKYEQMGELAYERNQSKGFDILIIDGINRNESFEESIQFLNDGGIVIWDDSSRNSYSISFDKLKSMGFKRLPFEGLKPGDRSVDETSVFYRDNNCIGL